MPRTPSPLPGKTELVRIETAAGRSLAQTEAILAAANLWVPKTWVTWADALQSTSSVQ
jgi:hypothetical protein